MKTYFSRKHLGALLLALVLLVGLCPLSASAAGSKNANTNLYSLSYYGDRDVCRMPCDMAQAYADALSGLSSNQWRAVLADPAGDGMPILVTAHYSDYMVDQIYVTYWDGTKAVRLNWMKDMGSFHSDFDPQNNLWPSFGTMYGTPVLFYYYHWTADIGPECALYYKVSNGNITLLRAHTNYAAGYFNGGSSAFACVNALPLVNARYDKRTGCYVASVSEMLKAGWVYDGDDTLWLTRLNGQYMQFSSYYDWVTWHNALVDDYEYEGSVNCCVREEGESYLASEALAYWSTPAATESALLAYVKDALPAGEFVDVKSSAYYYEPVHWAVECGITNGTSATRFSPNATCTQGQILTFLYRAVGEPYVGGNNPYTNSAVTSSQYYYKAMLWAYQSGIVTNTALNPSAPCTRSDVVTYLWRLAGQPSADNAGFTDVPASASYAKAVAWAVSQGITNGTSATTFSPNATCTRGQIVTFLYRNAG